jgi:riboflavin biosynthesis pyrimidine reductase
MDQPSLNSFEVLFDLAEPAPFEHLAFERYGKLGFPSARRDLPWIYSNFVQSLDGVASFKGIHAMGSAISRSAEDRWLMDLLRAHADAVLLGINTLTEETALGRETGRGPDRGPVYAVEDELCLDLRQKLGRRREMNIFVTGAAALNLGDYAVFDGDRVDAVILTTNLGAKRLAEQHSHPHVKIVVAGDSQFIDLPRAMCMLRQQLNIEHLLCEGGPTLYGYMTRGGLIDEKFLTVAPLEVGVMIPPEQKPSLAEEKNPPKFRPTTFNAPGFTYDTAPAWRWMSCHKVGDHQFNRYRRRI